MSGTLSRSLLRLAPVARKYHFITTFTLEARPAEIWETLARSEEWILWWRWLVEVELLEEGDRRGVGHRVRHQVTSPLRYRLGYVGTVTHAVENVMSRFEARGDLEGTGQFELEPGEAGTTLVTFHWLVRTPKAWMNLLAPVARPLFVWNHHRLMDDFAGDLAEAMGARLLAVENESLDVADRRFYRLPAIPV